METDGLALAEGLSATDLSLTILLLLDARFELEPVESEVFDHPDIVVAGHFRL